MSNADSAHVSRGYERLFRSSGPSEAGCFRDTGFSKPRPLSGICAVFAAGTWLGLNQPGFFAWMGWLCAGSLLLWLCCAAVGRLRRFSSLALLLFLFSVALVRAAVVTEQAVDTREVFHTLADAGENIVLRGCVKTEPSITEMPNGGARMRFVLSATVIPDEHGDQWIAPTPVRVDWYGPVSMKSKRPPFRLPRAGEGWQIGGRLEEVETRSATPILVLRRHRRDLATRPAPELDAGPVTRALHRIRSAASAALGRGVEERFPHSVALVRAMVLGYRSDIPITVEETFKESGTVHVFAISGLHVGILAGLLIGVFVAFKLPVRLRPLALCPLLVAYVLLTGGRPSAVRSCVMTLLVYGSFWVERPSDALHSLCLAALLILGFDPFQLLDLGLIFSFSCTLGILLLVPPIQALFERLAGRMARRTGREAPTLDGRLPAGYSFASGEIPDKRGSRKRTVRRRLLKTLLGMLAVSTATWLVSAPLTAYYFGRLSPIAILCNIPVIPLAVCVVFLAVLSLLFACLCPPLGLVCNYLNAGCTTLMMQCARLGSFVPCVETVFSLRLVYVWYAVLFVAFLVYCVQCVRTGVSSDSTCRYQS